jgi:NAD(P)-dependent dehydrogenase (short-subunit alcohol dehydrogenase family)
MATEQCVLVTGVSTGIGRACCELLVHRGYRVYGSVRRLSDADALVASLGPQFEPLVFDVTDTNAVHGAARRLKTEEVRLQGIVNNAGIAMAGPLSHVSLDDVRRIYEVNVIGTLRVVQEFLPLLGAGSRIVNVGSNSGKMALPFMGPYAASKHALEGLSESLRRELIGQGIDVIVVAPGAVATPIWDKRDTEAETRYSTLDVAEPLRRFSEMGTKAGREGLTAEQVAQVILTALTHPKPQVRYAVLSNTFKQWTVPRLLPARLLDRIIAKQLGLIRK